MKILNFIAKEKILGKGLQHIEVIILDGNKKHVDMIVDFIYPHINHLTIISKAPESFHQKADEIFKDVGLNMQVLSYTKGAISQGDVIIDTHYDDPMVSSFCKKGALYLDIANHPEKTVKLKEKQSNLFIRDEILFVNNKEIVNSRKAELLLTVKEIFSRNDKETMKRLEKQNIEIYKLM